MDLRSFEEKLLPSAFGFRNMGVTCYFNSLMQSLLSCTSLTEVMLKNRNVDEYKNNPVAAKYVHILDQIISNANPQILEQLSPAMWTTIMQYLKSRKSHSYFGNGQEDSHESFKMLMECWEDLEEVTELFTHKDHISIYCTSCSQWNNSQSEDINNNNISNEILLYYELARGLKSEIPPALERIVKASDRERGTIEGFLSRQITYMAKGYRCQCFKKSLYYFDNNGNRRLKDFPCACKCSDEKKSRSKDCKCTDEELKRNNGRCVDLCDCKCQCGAAKCQYRCHSDLPKLKVVSMRLIPEILVLMCPAKVNGKYNEEFPETLNFKTKYGDIKYRAVSQIIHSGGASGGHYWANSIRMTSHGPQWFELNDSSINRINSFKSNEGTYVVFYHKK